MKEKIITLIKDALSKLNIEVESVDLEHPADLAHGDYSTNVALILSKKLKRKPTEIANEIVREFEVGPSRGRTSKRSDLVEIKTAGAGFINFYLSPSFFHNSVKQLSDEVAIHSGTKKEKIMVEYTDANPLKEFHVGHLMTNTVGEAISRLFEAEGNEVKRACYQGDVGLHIAKAVWGALEQKKEKGAIDWITAYPKGAKAYNESEVAKKEIEEINRKIYNKDPEVFAVYEEGKKISLEKFEEIYKKLGTKFDYYFFESEVAETGLKLVNDNVGKIFAKSDGAIVFKGEEHGLHTRVFVNSQGLPTYEAKELGLAKMKSDKYSADKYIVVTGNEIVEYFKVLKTVLSLIYPDIAKKVIHSPHGMLRLPSGKMSSRTGEVITAESLINTVEGMVMEKIKDREFGPDEMKEVAEKVAVGAIKYSILKSNAGSDIVFDFDKSISFEGDSGPYLQYSYARAQSVLRKFKEMNVGDYDSSKESSVKDNVEKIEKKLYILPEIVARAASSIEPHHITNYLTEIAGDFNSFYGNNQIINPDDISASAYRVVLTQAFANVMKKGMEILAIPVLERM